MPRNHAIDHLLAFALESPWAITRPMLGVIAGILARRIAAVEGELADEPSEAALINRKTLPQPKVGSAAVIPMYGVLAPRINMLSEMSGGTTFEKLTAQLRTAVADPNVKTILLDVDSPGGNVTGATEFARELMKARTKKPVIAVAQYTMASAAYWASAGATEVVAAPSALIGALGVYTVHNDLSAALDQLGIKREYISAGEGKVDGNETGPLSEEARGRVQTLVNAAYDLMVTDVVNGRGAGMSAAKVRGDWKAHTYTAGEAKALGMIDRLATLDETLARVLGSGDADDRRALDQFSAGDTTQEASPPTVQDRRPVAELERQLLELQL